MTLTFSGFYCEKHNRRLTFGFKKGYPVRWYLKAYKQDYKTGKFYHCPKCLEEIKLDNYGKPLFND